jgi:hypothetical protein
MREEPARLINENVKGSPYSCDNFCGTSVWRDSVYRLRRRFTERVMPWKHSMGFMLPDKKRFIHQLYFSNCSHNDKTSYKHNKQRNLSLRPTEYVDTWQMGVFIQHQNLRT